LVKKGKKQMKSNKIGYICVSSFDQNTSRQLEGLTLDKIFVDKA
jgi:C-terminal processing protease CtpA/Prc